MEVAGSPAAGEFLNGGGAVAPEGADVEEFEAGAICSGGEIVVGEVGKLVVCRWG